MLNVDHSNTDGPPFAVKCVRKVRSALGGEVTFVCMFEWEREKDRKGPYSAWIPRTQTLLVHCPFYSLFKFAEDRSAFEFLCSRPLCHPISPLTIGPDLFRPYPGPLSLLFQRQIFTQNVYRRYVFFKVSFSKILLNKVFIMFLMSKWNSCGYILPKFSLNFFVFPTIFIYLCFCSFEIFFSLKNFWTHHGILTWKHLPQNWSAYGPNWSYFLKPFSRLNFFKVCRLFIFHLLCRKYKNLSFSF